MKCKYTIQYNILYIYIYIYIKTKLRVLETVVFPTALYGCEAWTINNTDAKRITSFEMKCYRKILRISWMEKVTNKEVLSTSGVGSQQDGRSLDRLLDRSF